MGLSEMRVSGLGFRVWGVSGMRVSSLGFRGLRNEGLGFGVEVLEFRFGVSEMRVYWALDRGFGFQGREGSRVRV